MCLNYLYQTSNQRQIIYILCGKLYILALNIIFYFQIKRFSNQKLLLLINFFLLENHLALSFRNPYFSLLFCISFCFIYFLKKLLNVISKLGQMCLKKEK